MDLIEVEEGTTRFFVPRQDESSHFPPGSAPVFYNRRMELNRDGTVLFVTVMKPSEYLDAMGATGVRGLRIATECGIAVTINDRDPGACELIRKNAAHPDREIKVTCRNVHSLLAERRYDAVDIDPYGSPAPYMDSAVRGTGRFLMVTATDTAPLCGAHQRAGVRRYFSRPANNEYHAETGLRTLLAFTVRETVKYDRGIEPLFCYAREHYVRAHFRLTNGAAAADKALGRIGYLFRCSRCQERIEHAGLIPEYRECGACGGPMLPAGPLWLGGVQDPAVIKAMKEALPCVQLNTARQLESLLDLLGGELPTSSHYDYHAVAKQAKVSPRPIEDVIRSLRENGYQASRAHYSGTALKTDAPAREIVLALKEKSVHSS
jgi:tRNA (guanine26-N2/guanine27-N2)-dimethyltransferase